MKVDRTSTLRPQLSDSHEQYVAFLQEQLFVERRRVKILFVVIVVVTFCSITELLVRYLV